MGDQDGASGHDSGLGLPAFDTTLQEKSSIQTADVDGKSPPYRTPGGSGVATGSEQGGNEGELAARAAARAAAALASAQLQTPGAHVRLQLQELREAQAAAEAAGLVAEAAARSAAGLPRATTGSGLEDTEKNDNNIEEEEEDVPDVPLGHLDELRRQAAALGDMAEDLFRVANYLDL